MKGWLLDANIVSELKRPRPNHRVGAFVAALPASLLFLSVATLAEIRFGIEKLADGLRRQDLTLWLDRTLRPLFSRRVLSLSEDVLLRWRQMLGLGRSQGRTVGNPDLLIAATAAIENLIVVSRDTTGFVMAEVPVLDPWTRTLTQANGKTCDLGDLDRVDLLPKIVNQIRGRS